MAYIPPQYRDGKPSRYCSRKNPYQGFCDLPDATRRYWKICQRCGSHWFTVPNISGSWSARRSAFRWERLETHLFKATMVGLKLEGMKRHDEPHHLP